jgi:hypothetical protein
MGFEPTASFGANEASRDGYYHSTITTLDTTQEQTTLLITNAVIHNTYLQ